MHVGSVDAVALSLLYRKRLNPALKKSSTTTSKYTVRPSKCLKCLYCYFYSLPGVGVEAGVGGERQWPLLILIVYFFFSPMRICQGPIVIISKFLENVGKIGL